MPKHDDSSHVYCIWVNYLCNTTYNRKWTCCIRKQIADHCTLDLRVFGRVSQCGIQREENSYFSQISMNPFILKNIYAKKTYMQILNISMISFLLKIKKGYLQTSNISISPIHTKKKSNAKAYVRLKIPDTVFCLSPFQILKKLSL